MLIETFLIVLIVMLTCTSDSSVINLTNYEQLQFSHNIFLAFCMVVGDQMSNHCNEISNSALNLGALN